MHHVLVARRAVVHALITYLFLGILIGALWGIARVGERAEGLSMSSRWLP